VSCSSTPSSATGCVPRSRHRRETPEYARRVIPPPAAHCGAAQCAVLPERRMFSFNRAGEVDVSQRQVLDDAGHGEVDGRLRCLAVHGAVGCVGLVDGLADHDHGGRRSRSRA
jgi:hypothetical protein